MSFLISQSEVNDCGVAICAMVLNHFQKPTSLEAIKIQHQYDHQQYSFAKISEVLATHHIESSAFKIETLDQLDESWTWLCFQVTTNTGLLHFVLGQRLKKNWWLIYDPAHLQPFKMTSQILETMITGNVQYYESNQHVQKRSSMVKKAFWFVTKQNLVGLIVVNSLSLVNSFFSVLGNSFLRIIFQEYQTLTPTRLGLFSLGLIGTMMINWALSFLSKTLNLLFANRVFQKVIVSQPFHTSVEQSLRFLLPQDFQRKYFELQTNLINLCLLVNQGLSLVIFTIFLAVYFAFINQVLMITSFLLVVLIGVLKVWKLKSQQKQRVVIQSEQNQELYALQNFIQNHEQLLATTKLDEYFTSQNLNHLLSLKTNRNFENFSFLERTIFYFYYLLLAFLLVWTVDQPILILIIFTSMTMVLTSGFERLFNAWKGIEWKNFLQMSLVAQK